MKKKSSLIVLIYFLSIHYTNYSTKNKKGTDTKKNANKKTITQPIKKPIILTLQKNPNTPHFNKSKNQKESLRLHDIDRFIDIQDNSCCQNCIFKNQYCKCRNLSCSILAI